jgi:retron-type reverse transcriptase
MFTYEMIYRAYLDCRRNKRNTINALQFEVNLVDNLCDLETSLNTQTYLPSRSVCFLTTSPKLREVFAADFRDRVVHHIMVPLLEQIYEPRFIHDSYSNRKGKGIHAAAKRARHFMRGSRYYLQLDIKSFFYSIDKRILFEMLRDRITTDFCKVKHTTVQMHELLRLVYVIIFQDVTKDVIIKGNKEAFANIPAHKTLFKISKSKGLPIGNLTSQFFANVYMNDFDNHVKRELKARRYLRYVDDFVLFANTEEELRRQYDEIVAYLKEHLGLSLRDRYILRDNRDGLDFLGYVIRPRYVLTRKRVVNNFKQKKAQYLDAYEQQKGKMSLAEIKQFLSVQASFVGHISHANSYKLYKHIGAIHETNPFEYDRA